MSEQERIDHPKERVPSRVSAISRKRGGMQRRHPDFSIGAFGEMKVETDGAQRVFEVQVYLDDLDPEAVRVELYANGVDGGAAQRMEMKRVRQLVGSTNGYAYA